MMRNKCLFSYYGAKNRYAGKYPSPFHSAIIEPFAGSAGYAFRYNTRNVYLYDINPIICQIWEYLINVSEEEYLKLPIVFDHIDDLTYLCEEAKLYLGFCINIANSRPCYQLSKRATDPKVGNRWSEQNKIDRSKSLKLIRHWKIENKSYVQIDNELATWFIDPPYQSPAGGLYPYNEIDYNDLGGWCKERKGQVIVCEDGYADWLPFKFAYFARGQVRDSKEVMYYQFNGVEQ